MIRKIWNWSLPIALVKVTGGIVSDGDTPPLVYGNEEKIRIDSPPFTDSVGVAGEYEIPNPYVAIYDQAHLVGQEDPLGIDKNGHPINEVGRCLPFDVLRQVRDVGRQYGWGATVAEFMLSDRSQVDTNIKSDTVAPLTRRKPEINYYHWITEHLPRIRGIEAYAAKYGEFPTILIEENPPSWITESLELMGISREEWVEWSYERADIDRLVVPKYVRKAPPGRYEPSRSELAWVRDRLRDTVPSTPTSDSRLFVSRADAGTRQISNRDEVVDMLLEYGFDVIVPSEYTVAEQIEQFIQAEVIIGPHGAGLTNTLFADDATMIELFPRDTTPGLFYVISKFFNLYYRYLIGDESNPNFEIDVGELEKLVKSLTLE